MRARACSATPAARLRSRAPVCLTISPGSTLARPAWQYLAPKVTFMAADRAAGRKFHSCTGGRALLDMLLACLWRQFGREATASVARGLNVSVPVRPTVEGASYRHLPGHCRKALHEAMRAMRSNLDEPLSVEQLCARGGGVSERIATPVPPPSAHYHLRLLSQVPASACA
jgi:hypothetical protein